MDIELIIKGVIGLVILLTLLIMIFILPARTKKKRIKTQKEKVKKQSSVKEKEVVLSFDELRAIVRRRSSTTEDLEKVIEQVVKYYNKIPPKRGIRNHSDFDKYVDLVMHLVRHRNTNKDLILQLDRALIEANPEYKAELNDALSKALNSLGG